MQDLVDIDVFLDAKRVIDSLRNKEIAPALAWCAENKSRLKKSKVCVTCAISLLMPAISIAVRWSKESLGRALMNGMLALIFTNDSSDSSSIISVAC